MKIYTGKVIDLIACSAKPHGLRTKQNKAKARRFGDWDSRMRAGKTSYGQSPRFYSIYSGAFGEGHNVASS
jgi:hypothetical protein